MNKNGGFYFALTGWNDVEMMLDLTKISFIVAISSLMCIAMRVEREKELNNVASCQRYKKSNHYI